VTPAILVNGNGVLAEALKRGPVVLEYDVRPVHGSQLEVYIDILPKDPKATAPWKTVLFDKPAGRVPLDFYDFEAGIYVISARACDAEGQPVASRSRLVHLRYGGSRALRNYEKRRLSLYGLPTGKATVFADVIPYDQLPDVAAELRPGTSVIKPGETVRLSYKIVTDGELERDKLQKVLEDIDTKVYWRLQGAGTLRTLSATEAVYEAPEEGEHTVKVLVRFLGNTDEATIYVTTMKVGEEL
ncbi:hypothetical protein IJT17_07130, partial [bacterium]|nr:hypothetical protein [bacterium]